MSAPTSSEPTSTAQPPAAATAAVRRGGRLNAMLITGAVMVGVVVLICIVSFFWTPMSPVATNPIDRLQAGSAAHWLGTDGLGRDVTSQLIVGSRIPLLVGVVAVLIALLLGVPWGILAGMAGRPGQWCMRWNDIVQAFPPLLLAVVFAAVFGASTWSAMLALGIGFAPGFARVTRSGTIQVMSREYAMAARSAGRGPLFTAIHHVVPNIRSIVIVQATVTFALAVLSEAALSFLGLGTPAPTPSWGRMLQEAQAYIYNRPTLILWPGVAIAWTVLAFNLLGDGLRDQLDPRMKERR
ncbi:ABC transporter permease [Acidipropionibacterium jensenii]|uniref:ABC transporter permease n=1 Tax=Acidipropionibacterium jensenii TaxID=1749 RepID=UPI00214B762B|nr:ABC transporter permease [Acidipropionibacterium jensenii]